MDVTPKRYQVVYVHTVVVMDVQQMDKIIAVALRCTAATQVKVHMVQEHVSIVLQERHAKELSPMFNAAPFIVRSMDVATTMDNTSAMEMHVHAVSMDA